LNEANHKVLVEQIVELYDRINSLSQTIEQATDLVDCLNIEHEALTKTAEGLARVARG
jgi:hypothetical protein